MNNRRILWWSATAVMAAAATALGGCGGAGGPQPQLSPTPAATPTTQTSVSPTPSWEAPTVAGLEEHLQGLITSAQYPGALSCDGSGPISAGTALTCRWEAASADSPGGPVFVAVLDDTGRYTFSGRLGGSMPQIAVPSDYPAGTISCAALRAAPQQGRDGVTLGMDYATVLHYWMGLGSPDSMDDDRDGLPCETVFPADVVERVAGSPLTPAADSAGAPVTREQVRSHAEALLAGVQLPGPLLDVPRPDWGRATTAQTTACGGLATATGGSTLYCRDGDSDYGPQQTGGVLITVLDEFGRYTYALGTCCGAGPTISDYPAESTCRQLSRPPDNTSGWIDGLDYPTTLFAWNLQGRPAAWDTDGDALPCEEVYPSEAVEAAFTSSLRP